MATITLNTEHVADALANALSQFDDSTNLLTMVRILVGQVQELEDVVVSCFIDRTIDTAQGAQLNQYGAVVGQIRDGLTDSEYRKVIRTRIMANRSNTQINTILAVVALLAEPPGAVRYTLLHPAAYQLEYTVAEPTSTLMRKWIAAHALAATPAGVSLAHIAETTLLSGYFGFLEDDDALGFDEGIMSTEIL
jgi:hypothetical protein